MPSNCRDRPPAVTGRAIAGYPVASALYQDGDSESAAAALERVIDAGAAYAPAYDLYYLQLMEVGRQADAENVLRAKWRVVATCDTGLQLAAHLLASGRTEPALALLEEIATRHHADPVAALHIADFWINRADAGRARSWLERGPARASGRRAALRGPADRAAPGRRPAAIPRASFWPRR